MLWNDNLERTVIKREFVRLTHSEAKQYRNVGVWSRESFIAGPVKETVAHAQKNPELPEGFQQSIFKNQVGERGHGVCDQLVRNSLIG